MAVQDNVVEVEEEDVEVVCLGIMKFCGVVGMHFRCKGLGWVGLA